MAQNAEVARARGEFQQSQTLLNLAKVGEQGAVGRGLLSAFFKGNIPAPLQEAFDEQQGMEMSALAGNEPVFQTFIGPLVQRGMLGDTPGENQQQAQHIRGVIRSLPPGPAATFARMFHESTVAGRNVFGMTELSPFIELAIETRQDNLGRQGREFNRQISQSNRRTVGTIMFPFEKRQFPEIANRPIVSFTDAELQAMAGSMTPESLKGIRESRAAIKREVRSLRKQTALASMHSMTIRQPDWPPTVGAFDNTYHADDMSAGVGASLLREVGLEGMIDMGDIGAIIGDMQAKANDRFWDDLSEEHAMTVIELDPTLAHLVADQPLAALDVPGVGVIPPDQIARMAKERNKTPEQIRKLLINLGGVPAP